MAGCRVCWADRGHTILLSLTGMYLPMNGIPVLLCAIAVSNLAPSPNLLGIGMPTDFSIQLLLLPSSLLWYRLRIHLAEV
jgi:hypothetical protein